MDWKMSGLPARLVLWIGYVSTVLSGMLMGLELSFNVYALPLKETFNFTQTQVEIVASMGSIGLALSILETLCTWLFGFHVTCLVIAIGAPCTSALYSLAACYAGFVHNWPICVYLIQLCLSTLNNMAYLAITRVWVVIFPKEYTGKVLGLYTTTVCLGKIVFAALMEILFKGKFSDFYFFVACATAICYVPALVVVNHLVSEKQLQGNQEQDMTESNDVENRKNMKTKDMLTSPFLQIFFWASIVFSALGIASANNITIMAESVGLENPLQSVYILAVVIIISRLLFSLVSDRCNSHWSRFCLLMIMYCSFTAAVSTWLFVFDTWSLYVMVVGTGISKACGGILPTSIILAHVGRSHFSVVEGCCFVFSSILQTIIQLIMGHFYDHGIRSMGLKGTTCYGGDCFYCSLYMLFGTSLVTTAIQSFNFWSYALKKQVH